MMSDNIRHYRKEKGLSQEEMAVRLHVVRQTVSKWENGKSVPDAEVLIKIADLLDVSVRNLLGVEMEENNEKDLTEELSRLNQQLADKNQREDQVKRANEKRGLILFLSFVSMLLSLQVKNAAVSLILSGICLLVAVLVLYRNLALLTVITTEDMNLKTLRVTTVVNILVLILGMGLSFYTGTDGIQFSQQTEKMGAMLLVVGIMIFVGVVSPRLPFTRHTGLRLPWTVRDQDTWNLAHRILGYLSFPLALLYMACSLTTDYFEQVTLFVVFLWIGIPGGISYLFFWKKTHGRLR